MVIIMNKNIFKVGITILLLFAILLPTLQASVIEEYIAPISNGNTLYVGGTGLGNYSTIQEAIDAADTGDTVFVFDDSSPYEECIEINERISLIGENKDSTVIIGDCLEKLITIRRSKITISGFTIKTNDTKKYPYYGIYVLSDYTTIKGNIISNIETGISVMSNYNKINDNEFFNSGLHISHSKNHNTILNNSVDGKPLVFLDNRFHEEINEAGQVILIDCINITIENTNISNVFYGILLINSKYCKVIGNTLNNTNIVLRDSNKNEILDNSICNIQRRTMYQSIGIYLQASDENIISGNNVYSNQLNGFKIYVSNDNIITNNNIEKNHIAMSLDDANSNSITNNNFIGNIKKIGFIDCKNNKWNGNYWGRNRILPKLIKGSITLVPPGFGTPGKYLPWFNIDWTPAKRPFSI
jgi:parallel beta-helix repeat protein